MKIPQAWETVFLPKWENKQWTWRMVFLLCIAVFLLIDSFLVPFSRNLDPGRSGEGIIFLIIGFRAVSNGKLPISVVIMGTCLAVLVACMNHRLLESPSVIWTPLGILLMVLVMFWGRGRQTDSTDAQE
jgi:chromate transport protein ChrA